MKQFPRWLAEVKQMFFVSVLLYFYFSCADSYMNKYANGAKTILQHFQNTSELFQLFCFSFISVVRTAGTAHHS